MDRKKFIQKSIGAMLVALPAYAMLSCSSSEDGPGEPNPNPNPNPNPDPNGMADCVENGTNTAIAANHGHTFTVPRTDVEAGVEKTYAIQGNADHSHSVTLTAGDFATLQGNTSINVSSTSGGGHSHGITVSCA